jgi:hypothetical protein
MTTEFALGQYIGRHEEAESADQCFLCSKGLKETNVELRVALTENLTLISADEVHLLPYGTDWSPRVGNDCAKRFPKESLFETVLI